MTQQTKLDFLNENLVDEHEDALVGIGAVGNKGTIMFLLKRMNKWVDKDFFLDRAATLDIDEAKIYITAAIKVPGEKDGPEPTKMDYETFAPYLKREIAIVKPKLIVCLGGVQGTLVAKGCDATKLTIRDGVVEKARASELYGKVFPMTFKDNSHAFWYTYLPHPYQLKHGELMLADWERDFSTAIEASRGHPRSVAVKKKVERKASVRRTKISKVNTKRIHDIRKFMTPGPSFVGDFRARK